LVGVDGFGVVALANLGGEGKDDAEKGNASRPATTQLPENAGILKNLQAD
jgi:hypothetical protein